jgi:hypothetical protein
MAQKDAQQRPAGESGERDGTSVGLHERQIRNTIVGLYCHGLVSVRDRHNPVMGITRSNNPVVHRSRFVEPSEE